MVRPGAAAVLLGLCWAAPSGCSSDDPVGAEIEIVSVDPRFLPASAPDVSILFRVTRTGAVRVEGDLQAADPVVARVDEVAVGGLASVQVPLAGFGPGSHLVTLVLSPASGEPPADAEASFVIADSPEPEEDGGVPPVEDAGNPTCADGCVGQARNPVCGSDFVTYDNECLLACAGVVKAWDGSCDTPVDCADDCFDEPIGFEYMVCGQDGATYMNECLMSCAGTQKAHDGPCLGF